MINKKTGTRHHQIALHYPDSTTAGVNQPALAKNKLAAAASHAKLQTICNTRRLV